MNAPAQIALGALRAMAAEGEPHRTIMLNAVRAELDRMQGGCPCEQLVRQATNTQVHTKLFHGLRHDMFQIEQIIHNESIAGHGDTMADAKANFQANLKGN